MHPIRAFVGHSFSPEDEPVVRAYTDFFDTLTRLLPDFRWDHAVRPEPGLVDAKVLELLLDKNVFIGICTRKERVVASGAVWKPLFQPDHFKGKARDFQWKTSDWIIQEIGVAIGRGLKIILLIEEGVKAPGAIQGNLEYITFERSSPGESFNKLTGMIASLAVGKPVHLGGSEVQVQTHQPATPEASPVAPTGGTSAEPTPDWTPEDYEYAVMRARGDTGRIQAITAAFEGTSLWSVPEIQQRFLAWKEYIGIIQGYGGDLTCLREMATNADGDLGREINSYLGGAYRKLDEPMKAAEAYARAAGHSDTKLARIRMWSAAAKAYQEAGDIDKAKAVQDLMKSSAEDTEEELIELLDCEANVAKLRGEDDIYFGAMEAGLELLPNDRTRRFSLAHRYSETGYEELAFYHYSRISQGERDGGDWNNLGVALEKLGIKVSSIEAYRNGLKAGETVAASNIAIRLLDGGFLNEALEVLDEATKVPVHDRNVERQIARAKDVSEVEEKQKGEAISKARPVSEYFRHFGACLIAPSMPPLSGAWQGPKCVLEVTFTKDQFIARGSYETPRGMLYGLLGGAPGETPIPRFIEYVGAPRGRTLFGEVRSDLDRKGGAAPKTLLSSDATPTFLAYLSADGNTLHILERSAGANAPKRYSLARL